MSIDAVYPTADCSYSMSCAVYVSLLLHALKCAVWMRQWVEVKGQRDDEKTDEHGYMQ